MERLLAQAPAPHGNPLYINDLSHSVRDCIGNTFNYEYIRARQAAEKKDVKLFEQASANALGCMSLIEGLLSTRPDLSLQKMIDEVMSVPGANTFVPKMIRQASVNWDYSTCDVHEQFRFFYMPRIEGYLTKLRRQIGTGKVNTDYEAIFGEDAEKIRKRWVNEGYDLARLKRFEGTTLEAVTWALDSVKGMKTEGARGD